MRFLCLHGLGSNSDVMKAQTASLRYRLGEDEHEYDFVDGSLLWPPAPGIQAVFGHNVDCYSYFDGSDPSASSILEAVTDLADYAASGAFDGVIGFSQGAVLAATLIISAESRQLQLQQQPFKCAIFLCGGLPFEMSALQQDVVTECTPAPDRPALMHLPVVNCWARNDTDYPGMGPPLSRLCSASNNVEVVHSAGHGVPSEGEDLEKLVKAVTATFRRVRHSGVGGDAV